MPRSKRKDIESLQTRVFIHYFCHQVNIQMTGVEVSLFVENTRNSTSKYQRYISGKKTPSPSTINLILASLPTDAITLKYELNQLFYSPLWMVLDEMEPCLTLDNFYSKLGITMLTSITKNGESRYTRGRILRQRISGRSAQKIEKLGSLNALSCLLALLKTNSLYIEGQPPSPLNQPTFSLLIRFFQHPSFFYFKEEIWHLITTKIICSDPIVRERSGLNCWNLTIEALNDIIQQDSKIVQLARYAKIVNNQQDAVIFLYYFYESENRTTIENNLLDIKNNREIGIKPEITDFIEKIETQRANSRKAEFN